MAKKTDSPKTPKRFKPFYTKLWPYFVTILFVILAFRSFGINDIAVGIISIVIALLLIVLNILSRKYNQGADAKLKAEFDEWDESIHIETSQYSRFDRARTENIFIVHGYPFKMSGKSGRIYSVTGNSCTCPDFYDRKLPCKHIYRLMLDRKLISEDFIK